jgi:hypothetical protein
LLHAYIHARRYCYDRHRRDRRVLGNEEQESRSFLSHLPSCSQGHLQADVPRHPEGQKSCSWRKYHPAPCHNESAEQAHDSVRLSQTRHVVLWLDSVAPSLWMSKPERNSMVRCYWCPSSVSSMTADHSCVEWQCRSVRLDGAKAQSREADIVDTSAAGFGCTGPTWGRALHRNASRRAISSQQGGIAVEQMCFNSR